MECLSQKRIKPKLNWISWRPFPSWFESSGDYNEHFIWFLTSYAPNIEVEWFKEERFGTLLLQRITDGSLKIDLNDLEILFLKIAASKNHFNKKKLIFIIFGQF